MTLDPEDIDRIADAVAERLGASPAANVRMVDAATVATTLGVDRHWVYAHQRDLGAVRIGGPKGRLRFDLQHVLRTVRTDPAKPTRQRAHPRAARRRRRTRASPVELIPYDRLR